MSGRPLVPDPPIVACPYCGATGIGSSGGTGPSGAIEPLALFGQRLLTMQWYCRNCHTPFECIKDDALLESFATREETTHDCHE